ncbi:MAG: RNA polymerase sigma factor, partial [Planctomycetes bacterium]|nr:RNA polymerase sigma factor [Planctomycetota bacterium]
MTAHPEELLAHQGFVRAVAQKLITDESWAADITQQTFLAVLENPPPEDAPIRGWLYRVVRNLSTKLRLNEARRWKREQIYATREKAPSTDEILAQEEVRRRVVSAVMSLQEPYRATLLLRYYEDLP